MSQVKGDIIEYDGKRLAVITAPLSGFRMEAVDDLNRSYKYIPRPPMKREPEVSK